MGFKPGNPGGPGRPKGSSGRTQALSVLDSMLALAKNKAKLKAVLQEEFDNNTFKFFKTIIIPLLPKNVDLNLGAEEGTEININLISNGKKD